MSEHARFAPSSADRQELCPGSVGLEEVLPDVSSSYADAGSALHTLGSNVLQARIDGDFSKVGDPKTHIGSVIVSGERSFTVDSDMADAVDRYATDVMIYSREPGALREVEQRVHFGAYLGVPDDEAFGTSDFTALLFTEEEILVVDLKGGVGVQVFAENNRQMKRYALGVLNKYGLIADFKRVRMVIHQPFLDHVDEWTCSIEELLAYAEEAKAVVAIINGGDYALEDWGTTFESSTGPLVPGPKQCKFCKASKRAPTGVFPCAALNAEAQSVVAIGGSVDDFADLTEIPSLKAVPADRLGLAMDKVWVLEDLAKAIRAEVERRLYADEKVNSPLGGYKLGEGKRGNRAWIDESAVEVALKKMRLKQEQMYTFKLKGPAPVEALLAKPFPRRWAKIKALYHQPNGKPSVMLMSDKRPAITKADVALDFEDLTGGEDA